MKPLAIRNRQFKSWGNVFIMKAPSAIIEGFIRVLLIADNQTPYKSL